MKNLLFKILPLLFLCSCITQQRCNEKFPSKTTVSDSIATKDSIVYKHDTINLPGSIVRLETQLPCPEAEYHKKIKNGSATLQIDISKGKMDASANCDSLQKIINTMQHNITTEKFHSEKSEHQTINNVKWYHIAGLWCSTISILIFVIWLLIKIK